MKSLVRGDSGSGRDLRVDFCRGIALWFIFIDHVPGNTLGSLTLRNFALCDATEAFVLLAGYAAGLAYGATLDRQGWVFASAQLLRRCGTLYIAHIFLFVVFTAQVGYSATALENTAYLDELRLDAFRDAPYQALLQALLLGFQPAFLNILPLYIVLLALLIPALPLLRRPSLLLAASAVAWAAVRWWGLGLPSWSGGDWFFNPLAWQLLFFIGCTLGYRLPGAKAPLVRLPRRAWLLWLAWGVLAAGLVAVLMVEQRPELLDRLPQRLAALLIEVDKTELHPFRLASIVAMTYLVAQAVPKQAGWLASPVATPLILMGQQGLPVFCAGIFLSFLGRLALESSDDWPMQALVNLAGLLAMLGVGGLAAWYRLRSTAPRSTPRLAPAEAAPQSLPRPPTPPRNSAA